MSADNNRAWWNDGYNCGESSRENDYDNALDEILPDGVQARPSELAQYVRWLQTWCPDKVYPGYIPPRPLQITQVEGGFFVRRVGPLTGETP